MLGALIFESKDFCACQFLYPEKWDAKSKLAAIIQTSIDETEAERIV